MTSDYDINKVIEALETQRYEVGPHSQKVMDDAVELIRDLRDELKEADKQAREA